MDSPESGHAESGRATPASRRRAWGVSAGVAVVALIAAVAILYLARTTLAERLADQWLARHGVASDLKLHALSLTSLSGALRLGDPSDPDLTVERLDVGYGLNGPWNGKSLGVQTRSLRLVRPRLRLRLTGDHLNFGAIEPLIQAAAKAPPSGGRQPDVTIEDGVILLQTPDGHFRARGGGALHGGVLSGLDGAIDPFMITLFGVQMQGRGGGVHVSRQGARLTALLDLGPITGARGADQLSAARLLLSGDMPYPTPGRHWTGDVRLALAARGVQGSLGGARADGGIADIDLAGALYAGAAGQSFTGGLLATGQLASLAGRAFGARGGAARLDLAHLTLKRDRTGLAALGDGTVSLSADAAGAAGAQFSALTGAANLEALSLSLRDGKLAAKANLNGGVAGKGAFDATQAHRLAQAIPILSGEAAYAAAIERGLHGFRVSAPRWRAVVSERGGRIALDEPARLDSQSGAHLALSFGAGGVNFNADGAKGAGGLMIDGGGLPELKIEVANGAATSAGVRADIAAAGALDALFARGARVQLNGRLVAAHGLTRFDLSACQPLAAARLAFEPDPVNDFRASLCPGDGPLIAVDARGWKTQGRLEGARGDVGGFSVALRDADGAFAAAGGAGRLDSVALKLDRGQLSDATDPIRFRPVGASGQVDLAGGVWAGGFTIATRAGHPIGKISVRHDAATGAGRADIDAGALTFAPDGLQPAELSPLANIARDAAGPAGFKGWFAWGPDGATTSGGELAAKAVTFKSPLGPVLGIDADLRFTSLSPLITAPHQMINVALVQAITPLSSLSAQFELGADTISVEAASGGVAKGQIRLEPVVAPLAPGATLKGVLVLDHVDVGELLAASSLANAVKMDAVVDGRVPFTLGPSGLTIQQGRLAAVGPGRLSISRKALTGANASLAAPVAGGQANFAQDLAYQAMEDLAFDQLDATINSLPADRLGVLFHIKGRHDPPQTRRASIALGDLIRGQALSKPMALPSDTRIDLTLDTSLNFGELVRALGQAWRDSQTGGGEPRGSDPVQGQGASVTTR
jgi:hypothetical protein